MKSINNLKMNCFYRNGLLLVGLFLMITSEGFAKSDIQPLNLKTEYKKNPYIDDISPRFSWELESSTRNQYQTAYQILVASSEEKLTKGNADVWDSGKILSSQTNQIVYEGRRLYSGERLWWKVRTWDKNDKSGQWSEAAMWEMGKLSMSDWSAQWIGFNTNSLAQLGKYHLPPSPYFRKQEVLSKPVEKARLYVSSLGLHEFYINGRRIGDDYFSTGWTDYDKRVYYNVYDVTEDLTSGENVFGALLSSGWYAGYLGYALLVGSPKVNHFYGEFPLLKAQIDVEYTDGSRQSFVTDESWKASTGALVESDILQGETYDAREELLGWEQPGYNMSDWKEVETVLEDDISADLQIYPGEPVRVIQELPVEEISSVEEGKYIVDFGQNFAGGVRLHVKGNRGDSIILRFGEMLYPDGKLVTENLREARAIDTYILKGDPEGEIWSPKFTYHGFQFVEISGLKEKPEKDVLTGLVMTSDLEDVGDFHTDNDLINQLYSNIKWTQWANYFDIPTDCPQRDERQGWTCDAQIYIGSAKFNNDISAFYKKWIRDLNDAQWDNGAYPIYAPMPQENQVALIRASDSYSPLWSDAGIICPYEIYATYGDTRIIEESMPYMVRYMDFLKEKSEGLYVLKEDSFYEIEPRGGFGDWLAVGDQTSPDLLASIYYFYNAKLMTEMCEAVGDTEGKERYQMEAENIRQAFKEHYISEDGSFHIDEAAYKDYPIDAGRKFSGHTQSAYANALYFEILEKEDALRAGQLLRQLVTESDDKLTTGFLGFKPLFPALSESGSSDKAFSLFLSTEYPSLGYSVANGATSIWERWDSYTKDKGFVHNAAMNSFSHYAFGAVNEWMFESVAGIKRKGIGYSSFEIKPEIPNSGISSVESKYRSIAGEIKSNWKIMGRELEQTIQIPVNTTAFCYFKTDDIANIKMNGKPLSNNEEIHSIKQNEYEIIIELGSGVYDFITEIGD